MNIGPLFAVEPHQPKTSPPTLTPTPEPVLGGGRGKGANGRGGSS